jgi:hypothetical protein
LPDRHRQWLSPITVASRQADAVAMERAPLIQFGFSVVADERNENAGLKAGVFIRSTA